MARIFVTGSSAGLGLSAGALLREQGHDVVLHARDADRASATSRRLPDATAIVLGDVSTVEGMVAVAEQANRNGPFDAVIHNVALGYREPRLVTTADGLSQLWAVNVLAPYVLTCLMHTPGRLIFLSSGMHLSGDAGLHDLQWSERGWNGSQAYADSKLHDVLLGLGFARRLPAVPVNVVNPGWVPTSMGGPHAPDDLDQAHRTQTWLAVGQDEDATVSGRFLYHHAPAQVHPQAHDVELQDRLLACCRAASGIDVPQDRPVPVEGPR